MFEEYRKDILREFTVKEDICTSFLNEKKILMGELEMAKLIIGDKDLCENAQKRYKEVINASNKEKLLNDGTQLHDLIDAYWNKKE